jgi:serine/threonine protein kinase
MDLFSAGTVLWEALTGRPLFRRNDDAATMSAVLSGIIPAPSTVNRALPPGIDAVVMKALQRNPETRYQTAAEFAEALEALRIDGATARAVSAYVQSTFEVGLGERRELIRQAPEQHRDPARSYSRPKNLVDGQPTPTGPSQVTADDISEVPGGSITSTLVSAPSNEEIEHRRMRGILAAAMLLLVGSALGLLLARAPTDNKSSSPAPPTNVRPATK